MGYPKVTAYDRVVAYAYASEQRSVGVDGDVVLDDGVAGKVHHLAFAIAREVFRSKCYALINHNACADDSRGADDDACAVVDAEGRPYLGGRVNVDAGALVGSLGDDARQQGHGQFVEGMGYAVVEHGGESGIATHDFDRRSSRWIVGCYGLDVGLQELADRG